MAVQTLTTTNRVKLATDNYTWINAMSAALTALGLAIYTGASGQISLAGGSVPIVAPGTLTAQHQYVQGFEIRQLQMTGLPTLYVKVYYLLRAQDTSAATNGFEPAIIFTIGASCSGTGVLGGPTSEGSSVVGFGSKSLATDNSSTTAITRTWYMSSDGQSYMTFQDDPQGNVGVASNAAPTNGLFARLQNPTTAAPVADGFYAMCFGTYGINVNAYNVSEVAQITGSMQGGTVMCDAINGNIAYTNFSNSSTPAASIYEMIFPQGVSSSFAQTPLVVGTNLNRKTQAYAVSENVVGTYPPDMALGQLFTMTYYGSVHTYMVASTSGSPTFNVGLRYE